jgi:hypothetical protein
MLYSVIPELMVLGPEHDATLDLPCEVLQAKERARPCESDNG